MSTIDAQNAKQIRDAMEVHCGMSTVTSEALTFSSTGAKLSGPLQTDAELIELADLADGGFPLDGSCRSYDADAMSDGVGLRSVAGQGLTLTISCGTTIPAVTIRGRGTGTITDGTTTYDFRDGLVFPFNAKKKTLTITNDDEDGRIEIESVHPGIEFEFTNEDLISVVLALRADLSVLNPQLPISDIEIKAYWPEDISETVSGVADGTRVWYYAGYTGNRSTTRYFHLSEKVEISEKMITIKGEDATAKLDRDCPSEILRATSRASARDLYNRMTKFVTDSGIKLRNKEKMPALIGNVADKSAVIFSGGNARDIVATIMHLGSSDLSAVNGPDFRPAFVDAGIPTVRHSIQSSKWTIYERDCGDVVRSVDRRIRKIASDDSEYGLESVINFGEKEKITTFSNCTKGKSTKKNVSDGYYTSMSVDPGDVTAQTANTVTFKPGQFWQTKKMTKYKKVKGKKVKYTVTKKVKKLNKGTVTLYGDPASIVIMTKSITKNRAGVTDTAKVSVYGQLEAVQGSTGTVVFPSYWDVFDRSNISGSFKWKGDPRMQPRDVFTFRRLDGTAELCTIETITLTHEGGGTSAAITYRKGVV